MDPRLLHKLLTEQKEKGLGGGGTSTRSLQVTQSRHRSHQIWYGCGRPFYMCADCSNVPN